MVVVVRFITTSGVFDGCSLSSYSTLSSSVSVEFSSSRFEMMVTSCGEEGLSSLHISSRFLSSSGLQRLASVVQRHPRSSVIVISSAVLLPSDSRGAPSVWWVPSKAKKRRRNVKTNERGGEEVVAILFLFLFFGGLG